MDKTSAKNVNLYLTEVCKPYTSLNLPSERTSCFFKLSLFSQSSFEPDIQKCSGRQVLLVGTIKSQAFLHPKATVKETVDVSFKQRNSEPYAKTINIATVVIHTLQVLF